MDLIHALILFGVGLLAGFINVMAGGGSMLTVPAMILLGLPGPVANGTNRIAILFQNFVAVITFFRKGFADFKQSLKLLLCALPGTVCGAWVGAELEGTWFNRTLAIIMCGALLLTWLKGKKKNGPANEQEGEPISGRRKLFGYMLMIGIGFYGGFIQIGVSLILMPLLNRVFKMNLVRVNMHKVFIICGYSSVALAIFAYRVDIQWGLGIALAAGAGVGGFIGASLSIRHGEKWIRVLLQIILVLFVIKLLCF